MSGSIPPICLSWHLWRLEPPPRCLIRFRINTALLKGSAVLLRSKERERHVQPISGPQSGCCYLGVFASFRPSSRVYVVRRSFELPYAVGGQEEHGALYYSCQRKQSKRADHIRRFFDRREA